MTAITDFLDDALFHFGLIIAAILLKIAGWYQRQTVELIVCSATALFVATVFISMLCLK